MEITHQHQQYMARCIYLASLGGSYTSPNPMVGAVVVCDGKIIGEGFHRRYGEAHAEPNAINSVIDKSLLKKSTLYVNLEPCSHYGKTPPCANLIVNSGIATVVIASLDPNPKVSGRGAAILLEAGIDVQFGVCENEARELNRRFYCFYEKKRPFITLKWAQTADGFIDLQRKDHSITALKISNGVTQQLTHKMRSENMAIMVGTRTVMLDNPSLTLRHWFGRSPIRVTIDRNGIIPEKFNIKDGNEATIIFTETVKDNTKNVEYIQILFDKNSLSEIIQRLYQKNIHSILVEGGTTLLNSFINAQLWDEANIEISNSNVGSGIKAPELKNAEVDSEAIFEKHRWTHYRIRE